MKIMIKSLVTLFLLCFAVPAWATDSAVDTTADGPKVVVEKAVNGILHVLEQRKDLSKLTEEDRQAIGKQVDGRFNYRLMARRAVGKVWKKQSTEQQAAFTTAFRNLLERSYGNRLAAYKGQTVEFDDAKFKKTRALVKTRVIDGNKVIPVDYLLRKKNDVWQVYNIKIEGVSLISTYIKQFKGPLKKDGFDALLKSLNDKVERLKHKDVS
ncbi:MAG: ABC transporter substrate-binding protein [Mariprofundaceae bacterium]|nr:ABC transporter substrate-binding protein [Mariprofundaceae bacterium]